MKNQTRLIHIVPRLRPTICGIGDHALLLAKQLRNGGNIDSSFLVGDSAWIGDAATSSFDAKAVRSHSADEVGVLLRELTNASESAVLLHYVGHGYARRGCPLWLVNGLEQWKRESPVPLITLFHEVHGTGPIWTSGFWTSRIQLSLASRVARLSDLCSTTTSVTAPQVRQMLDPIKAGAVKVTPVFSNVGEPIDPPPLQQRRRQMVIFGSIGWRTAAYTRHAADLLETCRTMGIDRVVDVGTRLPFRPKLTINFEQTGELEVNEIENLFCQSLAGYFTYPMPYLGKSTIFAAYCAHGMLPVTYANNLEPNGDGVYIGKQVLTTMTPNADDPEIWGRIAETAQQWYSEHRLEQRAQQIEADLRRLLCQQQNAAVMSEGQVGKSIH